MTANILERLRNESAPHHDRVEANPYAKAIMAGTIDLNEYKKYLELFYGYIAPLERLAEASDALAESGYDLEQRRKTPMLENDLVRLGEDRTRLESLPICDELPDLSTPGKLLGCFYVIEGSTMGGQMITKKLSQSLNLTPEEGLSYFYSYGAEARARWSEFRERLLEAGQTEAAQEEMAESAVETFRLLERWLDEGARR
ncbi:biliverdin-producing heme oxygenase [Saccharibacillus sp. O23]|uniref:biliverdin-producing heme oxygenase n=1 Tax=Saccharibacillus sp. O23 TaxID=2009338 RepID=UPI000B4E2EAB|nr:biliverdin-producing heme oxygenase [Saccharibacillus sp. O23]OWR32481.1 biliverdin-producing heme oxygenase [Saccharibacillus sp. O23]